MKTITRRAFLRGLCSVSVAVCAGPLIVPKKAKWHTGGVVNMDTHLDSGFPLNPGETVVPKTSGFVYGEGKYSAGTVNKLSDIEWRKIGQAMQNEITKRTPVDTGFLKRRFSI